MLKRQVLTGLVIVSSLTLVAAIGLTTKISREASEFGRSQALSEDLQWHIEQDNKEWATRPQQAATSLLSRFPIVCFSSTKARWDCVGETNDTASSAKKLLEGDTFSADVFEEDPTEKKWLTIEGENFRLAKHSTSLTAIIAARRVGPNELNFPVQVTIFVVGAAVFWVALWAALIIFSWIRKELSLRDQLVSQKNALLAFVSHELRTPLAAIVGLSDNLQEGLYGKLNEKQSNISATISRSGEYLSRLINDLLLTSELESHTLEIKKKWFEVAPYVEEISNLFEQLTRVENIRLEIDIAAAPQWLYSDELRLRQILVNLVNNAIKFTEQGGKVGLRISQLEPNQIVFSVWDTGVGIPPDKLESVFESFSTSNERKLTKQASTGLGLPITRTITHLLGGDIRVESVLSEGTSFLVTLPLQPLNEEVPPRPEKPKALSIRTPETTPIKPHKNTSGSASEPPEQKAAEAHNVISKNISSLSTSQTEELGNPNKPSQAKGMNILLVDDTPANLVFLKDFLEHLGHSIQEANDGVTAVDIAKRENFDTIFMDVHMPNMDGFEATSKIRSLSLKKRPRIIILSANVDGNIRKKAKDAEADDVLEKPIKLKFIKQYLAEQATT